MSIVICSFWPEIGTFWPGMKKSYSTWMPKRSCSQMGHGQKQTLCTGKRNLNNIKESGYKWVMVKNSPFCAGKPENLNAKKKLCTNG